MNRKGFTLVELLACIGIITAMLTVGAVSFGAYLTESRIRLGSRTVSGAFRAARQLAVSQRVVAAVVFLAEADGDGPDGVEIRRYDPVRDPASGALVFALRSAPEESFKLPGGLEFRWLPSPAAVKMVSGGAFESEDMRLVDFFPDGSSSFGGDVEDLASAASSCPADHVAVADPSAGKIAYLYVYPVTSFTQETHMEVEP